MPDENEENMMQMMKFPKSGAMIVWTYGALASVCFCIIALVMERFVSPGDIFAGATFGSFHITSIILSGPFLLAGMLASKQTGRVLTGMQVGLVAGLIVGIILSAAVMLVTRSSDGLSFVVLVLILIGAGAVVGEIGGLIGSRIRV